MRVPVPPLRFWLLIFLSGAVSATTATARLSAETWIRGIFTGFTPRAVELPEAEAWERATALAAQHSGSFALVGTGRSMLPLYQPGTILVLAPAEYGSLRRGQTAVYRNQRERLVAHVLIAKARDGWRVSGLNNRWHDMEPLVPDNLFGVVLAAYRPTKSGKPVALSALDTPTAAFLVD